MRILFLSHFPLFGNGSGNYTRKLAAELIERGHEVSVVAPNQKPISRALKVFSFQPAHRAVFQGHSEWPEAVRYQDMTPKQFTEQYDSFLWAIIHAVQTFKPDLIHVNHTFFNTWIANYVRSLYGIGFVVTPHGTDILQVTSDRRYYELTRQALSRAAGILPVSNHTRKWLFKAFGRGLKAKTRIVPAGLTKEAFIAPRSIVSLERKYDLIGKKIVIFVGRLTKEKGVEYLIRAAGLIRAEIYLIGSGPASEELQLLAKERGCNNVHFLGYFGKEYLAELRQFYVRADVLVLPSVVDESLGLVVLEAMALGTPVVASKKGGIPLAVKDGQTGFLIRAKSARAIAIAVNQILKQPDLASKLGRNARDLVYERFHWSVNTPLVERVYQWAVDVTGRLQSRRSVFDAKTLRREARELKSRIGYSG
ncbi:glycosyltransferase family 4 protein [Candidatus Berkelbacteria bacterium]|nr:glycosyltransferase family 4 protein [Candidatus Berkelbacteria bacterium]